MIPPPTQRLVDGDKINPAWLRWLHSLAGSSITRAQVQAIVDAALADHSGGDVQISGSGWITVEGSGPYFIRQRHDLTTDNLPEGANLYYTDARAVAAVEAAGIVGGVLPVVTGEIASGQPVFVYADDGNLIYSEI